MCITEYTLIYLGVYEATPDKGLWSKFMGKLVLIITQHVYNTE